MQTAELSAVFAALADPTRRDILTRLGQGESTVGDLAAPYSMSLPAVSRHLKVLETAGLISRDRHAQWRTNRLRTQGLYDAATWIAQVTTTWHERFDRLEAHLEETADD